MAGHAHDYGGQQRTMRAMGFADTELNRRALRRTDGILQAAIDYIVTGADTGSPSAESTQDNCLKSDADPAAEDTLVEMGLAPDVARRALIHYRGDLDATIAALLSRTNSIGAKDLSPGGSANRVSQGCPPHANLDWNQTARQTLSENMYRAEPSRLFGNYQPAPPGASLPMHNSHDKYAAFTAADHSMTSNIFTKPKKTENPFSSDDEVDPFSDANEV